QVMVPGQPPIPYMPHFGMPIYSPQQMHAYPQSGPPPQAPPSTGYPSPRGAPMMMHQNSAQGHAAPPPQMMAMGMNPQMAGVYGAGTGHQQQSELHQNWVPQRSPVVPVRRFSRGNA